MKSSSLLWVIGIGILFPLFFQLSGGIYNSHEAMTDSGGLISRLPLPISILACMVGMFMLRVSRGRASVAILVVGAMLLTMLASFLLSGAGLTAFDKRKVIMMAQILLPVMGLVLGQMISDEHKVIPKAFLVVLLVIVPFQLVSGFMQDRITLTHDLYVFSIYQHFQYVPLVLVCAYILVMANLWSSHRKAIYFLTPLMAIYAVASFSMLTMFAFSVFMIAFGLSKLHSGEGRVEAFTLSAIALICVASYMSYMKNSPKLLNDPQYIGKMQMLANGEEPRNLDDRMADWALFGSGIVESGRTLFWGHPSPIARDVKSSAHNWYLDIAYNFGVVSWLPTLLLLGYSVYLLWLKRKTLPAETLWLAIVVFYLVIVDSNFKVTLRQPYPGIFTYFLWGMLLSTLLSKSAKIRHA